MVIFEKSGLHIFYKTTLEDEISCIEEALSFEVEGAHWSKLVQEGKWDGVARFYTKRNNTFWFGLIGYVEKALQKRQIRYKKIGFDDDRDVSWVKFSDPLIAEERDYQRESILTFLNKGSGVILVPTRGGKTIIAAETIRLLTEASRKVESCIFIVDSVDLYNQSTIEIANFLGIKEKEIGQIRENSFVIGKTVTVATIQTIQSILFGKNRASSKGRLKRLALEKYLKTVEFVIVDEIHEYGESKKRMGILRRFSSSKYYLCLSATPYKENKLANVNVDSISGGVIYDIEEKELVGRKVLALNKVLLLLLEHNLANLGNDYTYEQVFDSCVIKSAKRNAILCLLLSLCEELGLKTLAMFSSVRHGEIISNFTGYDFISGESSDQRRDFAKTDFLNKSGGVLLVSEIWKKGITLPAVQILINVDAGKEKSLIIQKRGRVLGVTNDKKKALHIDFLDDCDYLGEHSLSRIEAYEEKLDKKNIDVINLNRINYMRDLRDYLIEFFELDVQDDS